jgi:RsiW-degrading membrane proteinase PrsW (M82 family)
MSQRHPTDVVSLVFGTIFAGFTVVWLFWLTDHFDDGGWWAGPVVLIVAGVAGLVAALMPNRSDRDQLPASPAAE